MDKIWQGQEKLWKVFWGGMFFPIAFGLVVGVIAGMLHMGSDVTVALHQTWFFALNFLYNVMWAIAVFKCRNNSSSSVWKWLALLTAVLFILLNIATVTSKINPRPLASYNPACVKTLEDFARQNKIDPQRYVQNNLPYLTKCTKEFFKNTCTKTMEDFAKQNGLDPQDYIKQNQSYLSQCSKSLEENNSQSGK